jgi:hypothetical protein
MFLVVNNVILVKAGVTIYRRSIFFQCYLIHRQTILDPNLPFGFWGFLAGDGSRQPHHNCGLTDVWCASDTRPILNRVCVYALGYFTTLSHLHRLNGVFWMLWLFVLSQHLLESTYVNSVQNIEILKGNRFFKPACASFIISFVPKT